MAEEKIEMGQLPDRIKNADSSLGDLGTDKDLAAQKAVVKKLRKGTPEQAVQAAKKKGQKVQTFTFEEGSK